MAHPSQRKSPHAGIGGHSSRELTMLILKGIGAGALLITFFALPHLTVLFRYVRVFEASDQKRLAQKMRQLERSGYIARGAQKYELTAKGRRELAEDDVWNLVPSVPRKRGQDWHFVLFDIPIQKGRARHALRARLDELGYIRYQDSVFVHKDDLRDVIEPFVRFYGIHSSIKFIEATKLDGEKEIYKHFRAKVM